MTPYNIYTLLFVLLLVVGALVVVLTRILISRVRKTAAQSSDLNSMMNQAVSMDQLNVLVCDIETRHVSNLYGNLLPRRGLSADVFEAGIHEDNREACQQLVAQLMSGENELGNITFRWCDHSNADAPWFCLQGHVLLERDKEGKPTSVVCTVKDVTQRMEEEQENTETASKYITMFEKNIIAMSFYDADGMLIDVNQSMKELCGFDKMGEDFFRNTCLFDVPMVRDDFDRYSPDDFYFCQHMNYPELELNSYVEMRIRPVFGEKGRLVYYVVTARDVTAERTMYLEQARNDRELQQTNAINSRYENELRYLLEQSKMYVWSSNRKEQLINFSRSLKTNEFTMTVDEYLQCMFEKDRHEAISRLSNRQADSSGSFNIIHHFHYSPIDQNPQWYAISGMPVHDATGNVTGHFGVMRNITDIMQAQEQLLAETQRAENSGRLKSAFLANMTHEIRTPLNAIVGFSDLLPMIDTEEEKREFIRIIRTNCDMLLRLINDILEASNLSSRPLEISPKDVDFALSFNDICQTLAQRVQEPGVAFIRTTPTVRSSHTLTTGVCSRSSPISSPTP